MTLLGKLYNGVQMFLNTATGGQSGNYLGVLMDKCRGREYQFMIGEIVRTDIAKVPFNLMINNQMLYQHQRRGKVVKRKRSHCGRNLYRLEFDNEIFKFWWNEGALQRPVTPSMPLTPHRPTTSTTANRAYRGKCYEGMPFTLATMKLHELGAYVSLLTHPLYSNGETMQVAVCISPESAARMHTKWLYIMLYGPLPQTITDANLQTRDESSFDVIHIKKEKPSGE